MDKFKKALAKVFGIIVLIVLVILVIVGPNVFLAINEMVRNPEDKSLRVVTILVIVSLFIMFLTIVIIFEIKKSGQIGKIKIITQRKIFKNLL